MRKIYSTLKSVVAATLVAAMTFAASCSYDDTGVINQIEEIKVDLEALAQRVTALENKLQTEVENLQALIDGQVVIVDVETDAEGNQTIKLSDGSTITVLAPVECTCEPATPCQCDPLEYRVNADGVLEVSPDGINWVAITGVTPECVVANVVVEDGIATITLADGTSFKTAVAELVEFEAAKSAIYVKSAETISVPFAINDAVEDINVMNQPLGWKAAIEVPTRAVGGMDYVLNVTGPAKDFLQYAEKSGKVAIHFNTAAGACKVMTVDVELAAIDLQVDKAGNITITNTMVDRYERENWGQVEYIEEFNNFYLAVFDLDQYNALNGDLESVYNSSWGEFNIPAAAGFINNVFANIGDNPYEGAKYVDGVNEKWVINATVESVLKNLDWYGQLPYEGNSFMVCVIPTDINANGAPVWAETIAVPFKQLSLSIVENVDNRAFNNAYFNVTLRGGAAYYLYPVSKADIDMYVNEYQYYASAEEYFWSSLESYLQHPDWYSFGFKIESDVIEENIALSDLLAYTRDYYYFETKPATEYVMCLFVEEEGRTDYSIEDLRLFEFATADLVAADPAYEVSYEMDEDWSLYTIGVNITVPESIVTVYSRWYDESMPDEDMQADLIDNGYARTEDDFADSGYTYYLGTNCDAPATTKYLGLLLIDAQGKSTVVTLPLASKELVMNEVDFSIENVAFTPEAVTVTLAGLDGLEVKNYKYYFISTTGGSSYQKTEEQCQDIAYSNNYLYKSTEAHPIIITSTADYKSTFSDGAYKLAVGLEFADGSFSKCVYREYTYEQPAEELVSVSAAYQESDPNWLALSLTLADGRVMTTTAGNGGVNYLEEGLWDFNRYYSDGFALGNTYIDNTTWVDQITILVKYDGGNYDLTVNTSKGKFHYNGAIEGLIVPGYEPEQPAEPALVEFTSVAVAAVDSNLNYHNLTFTDGTYTAIIKLCTRGTTEYCAGLYDQNGSFSDPSTLYIGGYVTDNTWNGAECWPVTMEVVDNGDGTATFNLDYAEYPSAVEHHGTYTGVLEGLTLVEPSEPEQPEVPGDATELSIVSHGFGYTGSMETEVIFTDVDKNQHLVDFRMTGIEAGTYNSDDNGIIIGYCRYMYGSSEFGGGVVFDSANGTITDNGDTTFTFDVNFVADGAAYHFTYTTPAQEQPDGPIVLTSMTESDYINSSSYADFLFSDDSGNNQFVLVVDSGDATLADGTYSLKSYYNSIWAGGYFAFHEGTLKINGNVIANNSVITDGYMEITATAITIYATVDGVDYEFQYNK